MMETVLITHHGRTVDALLYRPDVPRFPIVIVSHGYNGDKNDFNASVEFLVKNGIGAVTFTFCGSSERDRSSLATTEMTLFTEKEDLLAVIDYTKSVQGFDGNLFLFGESMGGIVSAMAAEDCADELNGMALLYPAFCIPVDWSARYPDAAAIPETIDFWDVLLGREFFLSMRDLNVYEKMADVKIPVLIFHGTADAIVPLSYSERATKEYPNAELIVYPGEGHGFTPASTRDMEKRLLQFVQSNR